MAPEITTVIVFPKQTLAMDKLVATKSANGFIIKLLATLNSGTAQVEVLFKIFVKVITVVPVFGSDADRIVKLPTPPVIITTTDWLANVLLPVKS